MIMLVRVNGKTLVMQGLSLNCFYINNEIESLLCLLLVLLEHWYLDWCCGEHQIQILRDTLGQGWATLFGLRAALEIKMVYVGQYKYLWP